MDQPKRPWWRKTRWQAVGLLWLIVAYPLSRGPAAYATARGWLPAAWDQVFYGPLETALPRYGPLRPTLSFLNGPHWFLAPSPNERAQPFYAYIDWWAGLARP